MRPPPPVAVLLVFALLALLFLCPGTARAQVLTIPEYRELLLSQDTKLARLDRELAAANTRLDRLVVDKDAVGSPRQDRSRELSAEIVKASEQVVALARQKRAALADLRSLRAALHERYTQVIDANLDSLGSMAQQDPGYGPLLIETGRYVTARDSLRLRIRIQESVRNFRDFPILATDGPAEIREKAGFYRDYVSDVNKKVQALEREMEQIQERERVGRRMRELLEDLAFQGEDMPNRPGDAAAGDIREDPALGDTDDRPELFARQPGQRIAELEEEKRQLELLRKQFEAKVREYDERARTIYSRQNTPSGEKSR
jgi:hypothetical protein